MCGFSDGLNVARWKRGEDVAWTNSRIFELLIMISFVASSLLKVNGERLGLVRFSGEIVSRSLLDIANFGEFIGKVKGNKLNSLV